MDKNKLEQLKEEFMYGFMDYLPSAKSVGELSAVLCCIFTLIGGAIGVGVFIKWLL